MYRLILIAALLLCGSCTVTDSVDSLKEEVPVSEAEAHFQLGLKHGNGDGVPKDGAEAARWFLKAAEQGHTGAQLLLGAAYGLGEGVPKDDAEAARWYRKAAEQGNAMGQEALGLVYAIGEGVPKDNIVSYMWSNLAGKQGVRDAIKRRDMVAEEMTSKQIAEAKKRSRACLKSNYRDC